MLLLPPNLDLLDNKRVSYPAATVASQPRRETYEIARDVIDFNASPTATASIARPSQLTERR